MDTTLALIMDADIFIDYPYELFSFMRETHKPIFHNSNVFLRDVQYAIQDYYEDRHGITIRNDAAESLAKEVARAFEQKGIFRKVNPQGYLLNYPELLTTKEGGTKGGIWGGTAAPLPPPAAAAPATKPAASKPAAAAAPAAKPKAAAPVSGAAPAGAKAPPPWLKK
jgi:hypothetical protein